MQESPQAALYRRDSLAPASAGANQQATQGRGYVEEEAENETEGGNGA